MNEDIWEYALKQLSVKAFDDLLSCGVRNLDGLLRLTPEAMSRFGVSTNIQSELLEIQKEFSSLQKTPVAGGQTKEILMRHGDSSLFATETICEFKNAETPIPKKLFERLSTRAKNVLARKNVFTVEKLMVLKEKELYGIAGIGRKTVHDILNLQIKIKLSVKKPKSSKAVEIAKDSEAKPESHFRIRFRSLEREHWPSDPADWSLLSHSFLELLSKHPTPSDSSQNIFSEAISDLGMTDNDLLRLRDIALLPDDPMELLLSTSIGYLMNSDISEDLFDNVIDYINKKIHEYGISILLDDKNVTDPPILYNINLNLIKSFGIHGFICNDIKFLFNDKARLNWFDIKIVSERQIFNSFGFSYKSVKAIDNIWKLKEEAYKLICSLSCGLPIEAFASFQNLAASFVQTIIKKPYHFLAVMGRLGFLEDRKWTLEELGQKLNVTRERVRQIEKKYHDVLEKPKTLELLNLLWHAVDDVLISGGGVCCPSEIAAFLKKNWNWATAPSDEALTSLISLSQKYEVVWTAPSRIILPGHGCVNCPDIGAVFTKVVEDQPTGILSFEEARKAMQAFCEEKSCPWIAKVSRFSNGYLHFQDDAIEEIVADEDTLYTKYAWTQKYGKRRLPLYEGLLRMANRPMHFTEVHVEINKDRPPHGQFSERCVYGNLERSTELLLWGPGTFIHKDFVSLPIELISKIKDDVISRLKKDNIPYLSITGIFELYKKSLLKAEIPSAHALYTCLKLSASDELICKDYPYVLIQHGNGVRIPPALVLEEYALEQDGVVTLDQLKKYAIEKLCVNEAVFMVNHLVNIPNLLRLDRGIYIHLNNIDIDVKKISPIIEHLRNLLENNRHISVIRLFNEKKISCRLIGISTPILLYSLIQCFFSDEFDFSRYPQISFEKQDKGSRGTIGVASEVIQYVLEKNTPCGFSELFQKFVDVLGYKQNSIYNIRFNKNILRYSEGVVVHIENLGWTDEKQDSLEKIAGTYLSERLKAGKIFGLITDLYQYFFDKLPGLADHICWTETLISELLSKDGKYRIVGFSRNAFVYEKNDQGIVTLDDLLGHILRTKYDGAANIEQFVVDMRDAGILKKSLTPVMLKEDGPVIIDRNVVKLARLR